ncbi:MAG TPA: hypothetical protein PLH57_04010 [Oligoflexia bacterium]|nr:hypothetical protein [Oligoflexia bacterium]
MGFVWGSVVVLIFASLSVEAKVPELGKKKEPVLKASHRARSSEQKAKDQQRIEQKRKAAKKNQVVSRPVQNDSVQNECQRIIQKNPALFGGHLDPQSGSALEPLEVLEKLKKYQKYLWDEPGMEARYYLEFPSDKLEDVPVETVAAALLWNSRVSKIEASVANAGP